MSTSSISAGTVRAELAAFLEQRTRQSIAGDVDLFADGLVSSLFALELVVFLESSFGVTVGGPDLKLDNFRTVDAMTALVQRLRGGVGDRDGDTDGGGDG